MPARKVAATTPTAVRIAASGMPRAVAAFRMRARRVGAAAAPSADTLAGMLCWVESALPDITAIS